MSRGLVPLLLAVLLVVPAAPQDTLDLHLLASGEGLGLMHTATEPCTLHNFALGGLPPEAVAVVREADDAEHSPSSSVGGH